MSAEPVEPTPRRVRVLPESLANQIAAGEVVERPASVVKELLENALDAGATRILVDLEAAGRGLVRVVDDGAGMTRDDAELAVLRHATSKIHDADELVAIATLGFRGEALPSIASVSRFSLVTRRPEDEAATLIQIEGGGPPTVSDTAAPPGTRVEVRDLFWNVPARLKFLKTDSTETQHVVDLVKSFALGYPHVHFRLGTGARSAVDFPGVRKLFERVCQVLGPTVGRRLFEVHLEGRDAVDRPIRVTGFVSSAREAKATQSALTTFVNGRRVRDRTLTHAVVSAFGAELGPGRFPQAVLWVHVDPSDVDVNVHPAKAEVRFRQPQLVHDAVARAIQAMLVRRPWAADSPLPLDRHFDPASRPPSETRSPGALDLTLPHAPPPASRHTPPVHRTELRIGTRPGTIPMVSAFGPTAPPPPRHAPATATEPPPSTLAATSWRLVARLGDPRSLILVEGTPGLALVDPVLAFAALTHETLALAPRPIASQPLLIPARLDLAPGEVARLAPRLSELLALGLHIEPFGGTTHQLLGLPLPALSASPSRVLAELAALFQRSADPGDDAVFALLARVTAETLHQRGFEPRHLDALVEHTPRALATRRGAFLLSREEIARRLGGPAGG